VPPDIRHLLQPKSEHKHITDSAANVDICSQERTGCDVSNTDNLQSIKVQLPLIARLRHSKRETPVPCIKTEVTDANGECTAAGDEQAVQHVTADEQLVQPTAADAQTTEEAETDIKKEATAEATAAAKGQQLARETIANIFGTELQPPSLMKIPMKRRAERDFDECNDAKRSRISSRNDDMHDRSSVRQRSWYVLE